MGSYINVGIVYSDKDVYKFNNDLPSIIKGLLKFCNKIFINYPVDASCEKWEEESFEGEREFFKALEILKTNKMSFGKMYYRIHSNDCCILVSVRSNDNLFKGVLFEIPEKELLQEDYSSNNLNGVTNKIAERLIDLWNGTEYSYAFCDSDADIEYQLTKLERSDEAIYSMLILKNNLNQPTIHLSSWCIDGITPR